MRNNRHELMLDRLLTIGFCWLNMSYLATITPVQGAEPAETKIVGYLQNRSDLAQTAQRLDFKKLTHLNLAFVNPSNDQGEMPFPTAFEKVVKLGHDSGVKVLVSICGGSASTDGTLQKRYFQLIDSQHREAFADRLFKYVIEHQLDGVDVDLEGPAINADYGPFIKLLASKFKEHHKLVTAALSRGYGGANVSDIAFESFDFINLMAYDAKGPWQPENPGQHASLEFAQKDIDYWLHRGVPKSKLVLGVPFYGYGFGQAFKQGGYTYRQILKQFPEAAKLDQVGNTIWYNGSPTIQAKSQMVLDQGLGGIMIWSIDQDVAGDQSLLSTIHHTLNSHSAEKLRP